MINRIIFFIFILLIPLISALQFSPSSLEFTLQPNEVQCKEINFELDSPTTVKDIWAESYSEEWSVSNFKTTAKDLGLVINYSSELSSQQKEISVCVSGSVSGDYKGALVFCQGTVGNSVVQFVIWQKVSVLEEDSEEENQTIEPPQNKPDDSRSSRSSNKHNSYNFEQLSTASFNNSKVKDTTFETKNEKIKLESPASEKSNSSMVFFFALMFLALLIALFIVYIINIK